MHITKAFDQVLHEDVLYKNNEVLLLACYVRLIASFLEDQTFFSNVNASYEATELSTERCNCQCSTRQSPVLDLHQRCANSAWSVAVSLQMIQRISLLNRTLAMQLSDSSFDSTLTLAGLEMEN